MNTGFVKPNADAPGNTGSRREPETRTSTHESLPAGTGTANGRSTRTADPGIDGGTSNDATTSPFTTTSPDAAPSHDGPCTFTDAGTAPLTIAEGGKRSPCSPPPADSSTNQPPLTESRPPRSSETKLFSENFDGSSSPSRT